MSNLVSTIEKDIDLSWIKGCDYELYGNIKKDSDLHFQNVECIIKFLLENIYLWTYHSTEAENI